MTSSLLLPFVAMIRMTPLYSLLRCPPFTQTIWNAVTIDKGNFGEE